VYKDGQFYSVTSGTTATVNGEGSYTVRALDASDNTVGESDLYVKPYTLQDCSTDICKCINQLTPVLQAINSDTSNILSKLTDLLAETQEVKNILTEFKNEFITSQTFQTKQTSDYVFPTLEDNKPTMPSGVFHDNTTYFNDQGDDSPPPALPAAPEPNNFWKDAIGNVFIQQDAITPDENMSKQTNMQKTPVFTKDLDQQKEIEIQKQPSLQRSDPLTRELPKMKDDTVYPLRWVSPIP
jgi:hypothetical protein